MSTANQGGWAVVTGASSGLGAVFAERLADRGMPLVLTGRDPSRLEQVRRRVAQKAPGVAVELVVGDLGTDAGVEQLVDALGGREIDILVNNAGSIPGGDLLTLEDAAFRSGWDLKVFGYISMSRAFYAVLKARAGDELLNAVETVVRGDMFTGHGLSE